MTRRLLFLCAFFRRRRRFRLLCILGKTKKRLPRFCPARGIERNSTGTRVTLVCLFGMIYARFMRDIT